MKKFFLFWMVVCPFFAVSFSQNIAINNDGQSAHNSAMLDVQNPNKGLLVPRVQLTGTNDIATIPLAAISLLVYNTATNGAATNAVSPGFYYWSGAVWLRLNSSPDAWQVNGNAGTNSSFNFLGTTDNASLVFKVNNLHAGTLDALSNIFFGNDAGKLNSMGIHNSVVGSQALLNNNNGSYNTASGSESLFSNVAGSQNSAYGRRALYNNSSGNSNVAIGDWALHANTNRSFLVAIGDSALFNNGTNTTLAYEATGNTAVGSKALRANTNGYSNSAFGFRSLLSNTTGSFNTALGSNTLADNLTGGGNVAIGSDALHYNQTGGGNTAVGDGAALSTNGNFNTALGQAALYSNQTGVNNTAVGHFALRNNELGFHNTGVGDFAGGTHTQNNNCTFLGSGSNSGSNGLNNATALGFNAIVTASNSVQLGNSSVTNVNTYGNLTVKNGKGIIRNTDGTQRKMVVTAVGVSSSIPAGGTVQIVFAFSESFSSAPEVYLGSASGGGFAEVVMTLAEVSSTGAKLFVFNPRNFTAAPSFTVRIVAIGPE